jgi:hypothetical protein
LSTEIARKAAYLWCAERLLQEISTTRAIIKGSPLDVEVRRIASALSAAGGQPLSEKLSRKRRAAKRRG